MGYFHAVKKPQNNKNKVRKTFRIKTKYSHTYDNLLSPKGLSSVERIFLV